MAAPIMLCFISIGAFLQVAFSVDMKETKTMDAIIAEMKTERESGDKLKQEVDSQDGRITELKSQINAEKIKQEAEREKIEKEMRGWSNQVDEQQRKNEKLRSEKNDLDEQLKGYQNIPKTDNDSIAREIKVEIEKLEEKLRSVSDETTQLNGERSAARQDKNQNSNTFQVMAFKGNSSSREKAVFVDCQKSHVIVQPANVKFSDKPSPADQARFIDLIRSSNYVIFLVRPEGAMMMRQYRMYVFDANSKSSQKIILGQEPVKAEWILQFPEI